MMRRRKQPEIKVDRNYKHSMKKRMPRANWINALLMRRYPKVYVLAEKWRELMIFADYSTGEFSALLKMEQVDDDQWLVTDWYLPEQLTTVGSVELTKPGAVKLMRDLGEDAEHYYGCFHIHPGESNAPPQMSNIDVTTMWNWVKAAKRGVFIVANRTGAASAILLEERTFGRPIQIPMIVEIGWETPRDKTQELRDLMDERVLYGVVENDYQWWDYQ